MSRGLPLAPLAPHLRLRSHLLRRRAGVVHPPHALHVQLGEEAAAQTLPEAAAVRLESSAWLVCVAVRCSGCRRSAVGVQLGCSWSVSHLDLRQRAAHLARWAGR